MSDAVARTLGELATEIRSKNAGPFWMTVEAFMDDDAGYAVAERLITTELIARLYAVPVAGIHVFRIPALKVVKVSFPRRLSQASLHDRDVHAGQHHVLLAEQPIPFADDAGRSAGKGADSGP